jgi:hypothetical protein
LRRIDRGDGLEVGVTEGHLSTAGGVHIQAQPVLEL